MSVDPAGGDPTDPQSWNRYAYVLNNPYKYVDPDGEASIAVNLQSNIDLNKRTRSKLDFLPNFVLDVFLPVDAKSVAEGFLLGPQVLEVGIVSSGSEKTFEVFARSTFRNERFRKIILKPGKLLERAFQVGKNKPIGSFTTRGRTASMITSTESAIEILALEGTSNVRPNRMATLEVLEETEALAGFIKDSSERNAFQIVIDSRDLNKLREVSTRLLGQSP